VNGSGGRGKRGRSEGKGGGRRVGAVLGREGMESGGVGWEERVVAGKGLRGGRGGGLVRGGRGGGVWDGVVVR